MHIKEKQGHWYAPYLASLITAGGRLLLAMLERCVTKAGGTHAWADTDALAIVSSRKGGSLSHIPGCKGIKALPWGTVERIVGRFDLLNPYDLEDADISLLILIDENYENSDPRCARRQLLGFSIAAKRYALYRREGSKILIVDPKAHGLGYLYPPIDSPKSWDDEHDAPHWIYSFWEHLLRVALKLKGESPPWRRRPQMMRMTVTTVNVLKSLHDWEGFRPCNFFLLPVIAEGGYPANVDPDRFRLVAPFESDRSKWAHSECLNIGDPNDRRKYGLIASFTSREYGKKAVVETFENLFHRYIQHAEAKSLGPDGQACKSDTIGLLGRSHVIAGKHRRIGKESIRSWEEGDDLESLLFVPVEYEQPGEKQMPAHFARASERFIRKIKRIGIRELVRCGCSRRILGKICRREEVSMSALNECVGRVRECLNRSPQSPNIA
jgi:hypothetical protein